MLEKPSVYEQMQREFQVSQMAKVNRLQHVLGLKCAYIGFNHVGFAQEYYEYDLRQYLRFKRDHRQLPLIFTCIAKGIEELHTHGIVHRDLKPDNIVISIKPLKVKIIDFDRSVNLGVETKGNFVGTDGYYPFKPNLEDGSSKWDIWALGAMILEADLDKNQYLTINNERGAQNICQQHLKRGDVNQDLKEVLRMTVMAAQPANIEKLRDIMPFLVKMKFRPYKDVHGKLM